MRMRECDDFIQIHGCPPVTFRGQAIVREMLRRCMMMWFPAMDGCGGVLCFHADRCHWGDLGSHGDGTRGVGFGGLDVEEVVVPRESQEKGVLTCYV